MAETLTVRVIEREIQGAEVVDPQPIALRVMGAAAQRILAHDAIAKMQIDMRPGAICVKPLRVEKNYG
jgi:hypothetical protein